MSDSTQLTSVPLLRKLWVVVLLTVLILTFWLAMIILLSGPVYRWKGNAWQPIGNGARYTYGGLLVLWLVAATVREVLQPGGLKQGWADNAVHESAKVAAAASTTTTPMVSSAKQDSGSASDAKSLPTCDSEEVVATVKDIIKQHGANVVDFGKAGETWFDTAQNIRRCHAEGVLDTGVSRVTYQVFVGPSGKQIVQAQAGEGADTQYEIDVSKKKEAEEAALAYVRNGMAAKEKDIANKSSSRADNETDADVRSEYSDDYLNCMSSGEAAKGYSAGMIRCLNAEIDFQNDRLKEKYDARMSSLQPQQAEAYRDEQSAWGDRMTSACKAKASSGDPVAEPHCVLNNTIRHMRKM